MVRARTRALAVASALALGVLTVTPAAAAPGGSASSLALPDGPVAATVDRSLAEVSGTVSVVVQLTDDPVAVANGDGAKQTGAKLTRGQQQRLVRELTAKQQSISEKVRALGGTEVSRITKALNAVVYEVDAAAITAIADLPGVLSINPVGDYEMDLSSTVPYVGSTAVQASGYDGSGVRVAVLDSGIDYTHANLGGAGTRAAYEAAYGTSLGDARNTSRDGLFPTAKVVDGHDFVGDAWPNGAKTTDPDPIDCGATWTAGCSGGHGTHVADIIAGANGVAPGASLLAVKVCSSVSSSCNGVAMLEGLDWALDPNGDGDLSDAVDVVNLSLGSSYGQRQDDFTTAAANAVRMGVTVVASAGNSADRPYITGSPASTPEVISVAQTQVADAVAIPLVINSPAAIAGTSTNTATVDWAPIGDGFTGDVVPIGLACSRDEVTADLTGKVALADRGTCSVSLKTDAAADAGAIGVLIANNAAGDAPTFSYGGGEVMAPTLVITQADGQRIKGQVAANQTVNVTVTPAVSVPLAGSMAATSSRGPNYSFNAIKPDIGAPGASVSAVAGSGTGEEAFGGTSGAAPVVSGAVAQLIDKYGTTRTPAQLKALLVNTAETTVYTNPATQPGVLAPITRIGGGELRVDRAAATQTSVFESDTGQANLSFGYQSVIRNATLKKSVSVRNDGASSRTYTITPSFRYADDAASGAVSFSGPNRITVPAHSTRSFTLILKIDVSKLPSWTLDGGANGGNGALLQSVEFDGYLTVSAGSESAHVPWHVLPHKSAEVTPTPASDLRLVRGSTDLRLRNTGAVDATVEVFSLTGQSPQVPASELPGDGDNFAIIDLRAVGVRLVDGNVLQFGVNTYGERAHPAYPAEIDIAVDANRDGTVDHWLYTSELGGFAATGQTVVYVQDVAAGTNTAYYYLDADLNSGNAILSAPLAALGLTPQSRFDFSVYAFDNYFTGNLTDAVEGMTYTPATPRYSVPEPTVVVPVGQRIGVPVSEVGGGAAASPSQSGLLLLYADSASQKEASVVTIRP